LSPAAGENGIGGKKPERDYAPTDIAAIIYVIHRDLMLYIVIIMTKSTLIKNGAISSTINKADTFRVKH